MNMVDRQPLSPPVHRSDGGDEGKVEPAASPPAITTAMGGSSGGQGRQQMDAPGLGFRFFFCFEFCFWPEMIFTIEPHNALHVKIPFLHIVELAAWENNYFSDTQTACCCYTRIQKYNLAVCKKKKSVSVVLHKGMTNHNRFTQQNHTQTQHRSQNRHTYHAKQKPNLKHSQHISTHFTMISHLSQLDTYQAFVHIYGIMDQPQYMLVVFSKPSQLGPVKYPISLSAATILEQTYTVLPDELDSPSLRVTTSNLEHIFASIFATSCKRRGKSYPFHSRNRLPDTVLQNKNTRTVISKKKEYKNSFISLLQYSKNICIFLTSTRTLTC